MFNLAQKQALFMHLTDAFIQSDLHCIQGTHLISPCIETMT